MRRLLPLFTFVAVSIGGAAVAAPVRADGATSRDDGGPARAAAHNSPASFAAGEVLVRFDTTRLGVAVDAGVEGALAAVGGTVVESLEAAAPGLRRVVLNEGVTVAEAIADLEGRDDVLYAEPNYRIQAAGIPNDSRFGQLWGLHNTAQTVRGVAGTRDADIDAPEAWNITTGSASVTVAVLDTGVADDHPDLAPNMWVNSHEVADNGVDDDGNGFVDDRRGWDFVSGDNDPGDEQGHGTHVAGTIGARGGNDTNGDGATDVAGVAWHVQLMPVRVLDHAGNGTYAALIEGIEYAARNGARIGNLSLSGWDFSQAVYDSMAAASDVTWIVAAGNDGQNVDDFWPVYPCNFDLANVVCVAATNQRDRLAEFSNYGPTSVDVAAPGVNTFSTTAYSRVFFDDFESSSGRWVTGGTPDTWAPTTSVPLGAQGTWLTDSPDGRYPNSSDNWARTTALELTGMRHCAVKFYALTDTESWFDFFSVEAATSSMGPWTELGRWSGFLDGAFDARMPATFDGVPEAYVRIRLNPDDMYDGDGLYIDDFAIECSGGYSADSFRHLSGTSMATPHVTGVATLVLARNPDFDTAQLRAKLLASVDTKPSLRGKVATGGRINADKAVR